jgi:hypothetical protein
MKLYYFVSLHIYTVGGGGGGGAFGRQAPEVRILNQENFMDNSY